MTPTNCQPFNSSPPSCARCGAPIPLTHRGIRCPGCGDTYPALHGHCAECGALVRIPYYSVDLGSKRRLRRLGYGGDVDPESGQVFCLKHMDTDWFPAEQGGDDEEEE